MADQTSRGVKVYYKVEGTFNTAPGNTGAKRLRYTGGPGGQLKRAQIQSEENRADKLTTMGRLGSKSTTLSYGIEHSIGSYDDLLEAVMRGTFAAQLVITEATASLTSITTTTNTIVATAGSWITAGIRKGDVIRLTNHSTSANNNINLLVLNVTTSTITVAGTPLTANAVADTTFTVTRLKKLTNPATPTRRSWYVEEYNEEIDSSVIYGGARASGLTLVGNPDGMANGEVSFVGASQSTLTGASAPYYTSPTESTTIPLVFSDATLCLNGAAVANLTAFQLTLALNATTQPRLGNNDPTDVYDNRLAVNASISMIRQDLNNIARFGSETEFDLAVLLVEPESEPKDCMSFYIGRVKIADLSKALGQDGPLIENIPLMIGKQEGVTGVDDSMITICSSAA